MSSNENQMQNYNLMVSCGSDFNLMKVHMVNKAALSIEEMKEKEEDQDDLEPDGTMQPPRYTGGKKKLVTISKRLTQPHKEERADEMVDQSFEDEMNKRAHRMVKEQLT